MSNPPLTPATPGQPATPVDAATPSPTPAEQQTDFAIGEEVYALTHRAHPQSSGSIDDVFAVPMPGQNAVMVAVNVSLQNNEEKQTWIKTIQVATDAGGDKHTDDAAPAVDAKSYLETLP